MSKTRCSTNRVPHRGRAARPIWLAVAACSLLCGCRSLGRSSPVPQKVATCRQLTQQGINAIDRGDWKRAESLLARAVQTFDADVDARRQYAETLWHRGAKREALAQLEEARRLASEDPALAVRTGELYLDLGDNAHANAMVAESLRLDPKFAPGWALRGRVSAAEGQWRQALAEYQRSLGYAPENREVAILLAETYRHLNEPERALLTLQAVADEYARGDEPQQVLHLQGLALMALARYEEASAVLAHAARRDRRTPDVLCNLAEAELLAGRLPNARSTVQEALALDPSHAASRALSARMALATTEPVRR